MTGSIPVSSTARVRAPPSGYPIPINDDGWIVFQHHDLGRPVLWRAGAVVDFLGNRYDDDPDHRAVLSGDLNDRGQVLVRRVFDGEYNDQSSEGIVWEAGRLSVLVPDSPVGC